MVLGLDLFLWRRIDLEMGCGFVVSVLEVVSVLGLGLLKLIFTPGCLVATEPVIFGGGGK